MSTIKVVSMTGAEVGTVELNDAIFGVEPNMSVVHEVVKNHLANCRQGTQSALTRAEVSGGGKKPWRQKGTGHARQGSTRSPQWTHGGIAFAPKPRTYSYVLNKKVKRLALKYVMSSKAKDREIVVVDKIAMDEIKTKTMRRFLAGIGAGKSVVITPEVDEILVNSARTIPGMVVICPSDDLEARAAVRAAYAHKGPVYLRFSRLATPSLHDANNYTFEIGKGEVLCDGFDLAIISTGLMTSEALKAAVTLKRQDAISVRVINMPTIKPLDEEIVLRAARECHKIITVEEHSVIGGLGEAVCSLLSENAPTPVRRIGVQDKFGHSGPAWEVLRDYGLTADAIADAVRSFVKEDQ